MRAFLGYWGVVDHQHGNQPTRLTKQFRLHRPSIPPPGRNEVVQLIPWSAPPKAAFSSRFWIGWVKRRATNVSTLRIGADWSWRSQEHSADSEAAWVWRI